MNGILFLYRRSQRMHAYLFKRERPIALLFLPPLPFYMVFYTTRVGVQCHPIFSYRDLACTPQRNN